MYNSYIYIYIYIHCYIYTYIYYYYYYYYYYYILNILSSMAELAFDASPISFEVLVAPLMNSMDL